MRGAIKPRQIINYDAGIVLIDHRQQRKNNPDNTNQHCLNAGQPHIDLKNRPAEATARSIAFPGK